MKQCIINITKGNIESDTPYLCLPEEDFNKLISKVAKYDALKKSHSKLVNACALGLAIAEWANRTTGAYSSDIKVFEQALAEAE